MGILMERKNNVIEFIKIFFGGSENLLEAQNGTHHPTLASATMQYLQDKSLDEISMKDLNEVIKQDLKLENDQIQSKHRISIANYFVNSFLNSKSISQEPKENTFKSMQIYPDFKNGIVHKSIPHIWGMELASGTAQFISDIPTYENEAYLILIRSTRAHAKITLNLDEAIKMKGKKICMANFMCK